MVKNPPANARDIRHMGSTPQLGRSLGVGNSNPLQWATVYGFSKSHTGLKWLCTFARLLSGFRMSNGFFLQIFEQLLKICVGKEPKCNCCNWHFKKILFIFGCVGSSLLCTLFSSCGKPGLLSSRGAWASHFTGFTCSRAWTLGMQVSLPVAHGLSCSMTCGIFLD